MSSTSNPTCAVIHANETYEGKQGLTYFAGISAQSVGSKALCLHLLTIPREVAPMLICMKVTRPLSTF